MLVAEIFVRGACKTVFLVFVCDILGAALHWLPEICARSMQVSLPPPVASHIHVTTVTHARALTHGHTHARAHGRYLPAKSQFQEEEKPRSQCPVQTAPHAEACRAPSHVVSSPSLRSQEPSELVTPLWLTYRHMVGVTHAYPHPSQTHARTSTHAHGTSGRSH